MLSRPRSAPQRRATISGTSPSHYRPYINVSEIWSQVKATQHHSGSKDRTGNKGDTGSNTSTLHSKDSGHSTMGSLQRGELEMRHKEGPSPGRPVTIGNFSVEPAEVKAGGGSYMNVPAAGSQPRIPSSECGNYSLDSGYGYASTSNAPKRSYCCF